MNILLIGSGGRENALAWKIATSHSFINTSSVLYCVPGNPGISEFAECVPLSADNHDALLEFAKKHSVDLVVIGPEKPLSDGLADLLRSNGIRVFGPDKEAAEIESSKKFAKELMKKHGIPTAGFRSFSRYESDDALEYVESCPKPVVIKADGLAAGKGVIIATNNAEAVRAVELMLANDSYGSASEEFVVEEYLHGEEVSVFCITDGQDFILLPFSQDHKKIGEGETGKNTGGMGSVSPALKFMTPELSTKIESKILKPVLQALKQEGRTFKGCLYCGLMVCNGEPYVIEFNCRFGDPETQSVLPLIGSDFLDLLLASAEGKISEYEFHSNNLKSGCVVIASSGYPDKFEKGFEITLPQNKLKDSLIFHSGTVIETGKLISAGGRVLSVVGLSEKSMEEAVQRAYEAVSHIHFKGMTYRKDIGSKLLTTQTQ